MTELDVLVAGADQWSKSLQAAVDPISKATWQAFIDASEDARQHVLTVMAANPRKDLVDLLNRPDVVEALHIPFDEAAAVAHDHIDQAWSIGVDSGVAQANAALKVLGLKKEAAAEVPTTTPEKMKVDVDHLADSASQHLVSLLLQGEKKDVSPVAEKIGRDAANRTRYSTQHSGTAAHTQAELATLAKAAKKSGLDVRKMWVSRLGPATCGSCAALHGTVVDLKAAFPASTFGKVLPIYGGILHGPPRHPNCRCKLVPVLVRHVSDSKKLKAKATKWWKQATAKLRTII